MKINEFIMKHNNAFSTITEEIETKSYLSFAEKKELAQRIINKCKTEEDGLIRINEMDKYIIFTIEIIMAYTNLEFDENLEVAISEYDALCKAELLNPVLETFQEEYSIVLSFVSMQEDYLLQENKLEFQVAKFLNKLTNSLEALAGAMNEQLSEMNINMDEIAQLADFMKKYK